MPTSPEVWPGETQAMLFPILTAKNAENVEMPSTIRIIRLDLVDKDSQALPTPHHNVSP